MTTDISIGAADVQCVECVEWVFANVTHELTDTGHWVKFTCPRPDCGEPNQIFDDGTPDPDIDHDERATQ